jgi:hypothetical protein
VAPIAHDGHRLEAAVRVCRKAGHGLAVVHAPAVLATKVLPQIAPCQRGLRALLVVAGRVGIVVMHAEQKRVYGLPGEGQGLDLEEGVLGHGG